ADAVAVPYKGNAPVALALAAGEVDYALLDYVTVRPMVERGNVRLLAVAEPRRAAVFPDVPAVREVQLTRDIASVTPWFLVLAPAHTPAPVIRKLNQEVAEVLAQKDVQEVLRAAGIETETGTPAEAAAYFQSQRDQMARQVQALGISLKN